MKFREYINEWSSFLGGEHQLSSVQSKNKCIWCKIREQVYQNELCAICGANKQHLSKSEVLELKRKEKDNGN